MSARGQEIGKGTGGVGGVVRRHGKSSMQGYHTPKASCEIPY